MTMVRGGGATRRLDVSPEPQYSETMKNVTVSLDDESYRRARVKAAQTGRSLSSMVRECIQSVAEEKSDFERLHEMEFELRRKIDARGGGFSAGDRLSRDEIHDRRR